MPGYLYSYKKFKDEFETVIIKENDSTTMEKLQKLVAPFVLRRIKKEVLKELPDKTEQIKKAPDFTFYYIVETVKPGAFVLQKR